MELYAPLPPPPQNGKWSINIRSACEGAERHEYYKMDNLTKLNGMFWNTLSLLALIQ